MTNYEEMSLEELEALKQLRVKKKLADELKSEDDVVKATEKEEYDAQIKADAIEEYKNENPPKDKLIQKVGLKKDTDIVSEHVDYFNRVIEASDDGFVPYDKMGEFNYTSSDEGCEVDAAAWKKEDVFTNLVWHSMYCEAGLRDICVKGLDVKAGDGLAVQIRTIGKFGAPTQVSACTCLSCETAALSNYSIDIKSYGLLQEICELNVFEIGEVLRTQLIKAMSLRWAQYFDAQIYAQLATGLIPGNTETLGVDICNTFDYSTTGCCTDSAALLFNAIIDLEAAMREGATPYNPDYVIVSPTVAAILKAKDGVAMPYIMQSQVNVSGGVLTHIGALKVIEYCGANSCASGATLAIMIDSSRAVGFAFGKPPKIEQERNIDCDSTTVAMWSYFGTKELDLEAIGHIKNGS